MKRVMRRYALGSILCIIIGLGLGTLGAVVLFAQYLEWRSFGNWNAVSLRYVLAYFEIQPLPFISPASRLWDLPISTVLIAAGGALTAVGAYCRQK
jgi:hypothetical protein